MCLDLNGLKEREHDGSVPMDFDTERFLLEKTVFCDGVEIFHDGLEDFAAVSFDVFWPGEKSKRTIGIRGLVMLKTHRQIVESRW